MLMEAVGRWLVLWHSLGISSQFTKIRKILELIAKLKHHKRRLMKMERKINLEDRLHCTGVRLKS